MESGQLYQGRSKQGGGFTEPTVGNIVGFCRPVDDVVTEDDPNYGITSLSDVYLENQGTVIVQVNEHTLLPGDEMLIELPNDWAFEFERRIRFLNTMSFALPVATFPQLYSGPRLLISYIPYPKI